MSVFFIAHDLRAFLVPFTVLAIATIRRDRMKFITDLDTPFLQISPADYLTLRDATQGVAVFGQTGSGKTSASGKALASAYLRAGMGGLVLVAKHEEIELWERYAHENGRSASLVMFGERGGGGFNFLDHELKRHGQDGVGSVIECLMTMLEADRLVKPNASNSEQPFWGNSARQLLRNTIPVLYAANGNVTVDAIYRFVTSAPTDPAKFKLKEGEAATFMLDHLWRAGNDPKGPPLTEHELMLVMTYWHDEFARLDDKTRGNIVINLSTNLDRFMRGRLHRHFCEATTLAPEDTFDGRIIVMAMPGLSWNEDGWIAQHLFKFMWQRAVLGRGALPAGKRNRPVFLWADEAQYFVNSHDAAYQATCRSFGGCTVYLTQSMPSYYAAFGGDTGKNRADQLMGNFGTKVFHANGDPETNRWAADIIGRDLVRRANYSEGENVSHNSGYSSGSGQSHGQQSSSGQQGWSSGNNSGNNTNRGTNAGRSTGESRNRGYSEAMDYIVEPAEFARNMRKGGKSNGLLVDGILFQTGASFNESGRNFLRVSFRQDMR